MLRICTRMSGAIMNKKLCVLGLILLTNSCSKHPEESSRNFAAENGITANGQNTEPNAEPDAVAPPTRQSASPIRLDLQRASFHIQAPDAQWSLVSDPSNELAPLEFYNPATGLRATLLVSEVGADEAAQVPDRAQAELQSQASGADSTFYSELRPLALGQLNGMGWEIACRKSSQIHQAMGMSALVGNRVFQLSMSNSDQLRNRAAFSQLFHEFFSGLHIDNALIKAQGPEVGPESISEHHSAELGYTWRTSDTLWHRWTSLEAINTDPDLTLVNAEEDVSLFVYGAVVDPNEVSSRDLFKVYLIRLGLDPNSADLVVHKKGSGESFVQDFEVVQVVSGFDFLYRGRFIYENGRGVMIATWTQNANRDKYSKVMERALNGMKLEATPAGGLPQQSRLLQFNARIVNQVGLLRLADDQPLVALSYFEKANKLDPSEPMYLVNCGFIYQMKNLFGPGIDFFQSQIGMVEKSGKLLAVLGEMYEGLHDYNRALRYYEMALKFTPNDPELVINESDGLWGIGQRTQSYEVVEALYKKQPSARLGVYLAKTLMGLDQYAEAVDKLYALKKQYPLNREMGLALIDALTFLQRYQEALAVSDELLPIVKNDADVWAAHGKSQFHLKQYRLAEVSLQKALKLDADNEDARSFLSATKAYLGKADIHSLQTVIDPVAARPSNLKDRLVPGLVDSAKAGDFPAVVHFQEEVLKTSTTAPWVRTEQALVQILDTRGLGLFQEFTYSFLPGFDRVHVNALEVYDSHWKLKTRWSINQAYITYLKESGNNGDAQMAHLPLTDLAVGDFIYLQVSRASIEISGAIPFTNHICSRSIPVGSDLFRIQADTSQLISEEYGPIERKTLSNGVQWRIDYPVVIRKEVFMPAYRDFGAGVLVAGKQSWEQVGHDYQAMIQHQFKSSIPVREKAFEIKGQRMGDKETVFLFADWVRSNIRYRDIAFGGHSLIPAPSLLTLNEKQGDCKDESLLLKEMLDVVGIKSYLALINLNESGSEALPTIQQFNHMVLFIPATKNWPDLWIDPTDKAGDRRPISLDLEGKVALVINGDSSFATVTPILEKDQEHQAYLDHNVYIDTTGKAEFRDSLTLYGKFASALRAEFLSRDGKERRSYIGNWITQSIPDAELTNLKADNVLDFSKPLVLIITFTSPHYFAVGKDKISGVFPDLWERSFMRLPKVTQRFHPLRLPHETSFEWSLHVRPPAGWNVSIQEPTSKLKKPVYLEVPDGKPLQSPGQSQFRWQTLAIYADASEYEKICTEWESVVDQTAPFVVIAK